MGPPVRANSAPMRQNAEVEYFGKGNSMETAGNGPSKARWRRAAAVFGIVAAAACVAAAGLVFWGQPWDGSGAADGGGAEIAGDRGADGGSGGQGGSDAMEGVVLSGPTAQDAASLPDDEQWPGQSLGFVGPNGEGAYTPADWNAEEEYREIISKVCKPENEIPEITVGEGDSKYVKGIVMISFDRSCSELEAHEIVWSLGGIWGSDDFGYSTPWLNDVSATIYFPDYSDRELLEEIVENPKSHEEVISASTCGFSIPSTSDSVAAESFSVDLTSDQYPLDQSRFRDAWEVSKCSRSAVVAVIGGGFSLDHPDLADNIIRAVDASTEDCLPLTESRLDTLGHGMMVAGAISAVAGNGVGIDGASYNALIVAYRAANSDGSLPGKYIINALRDVGRKGREQIQVVNMSFESTTPNERIGGLCKTLHEMGIVIVAASGNLRKDEQSVYMTKYPAAYDGVIGVGCVDSSGSVSSFSNCNPGVDLVAGGESVPLAAFPSSGSYYKVDSGTSYSAPLVSAAAALLLARTPTLSPDEVEYALESTAVDLGEEGRDDVYGHGLLDAAAALGSVPEGRQSVKAKLNAGMAYLMQNYAGLPESLRPSANYVFDYILGLYGKGDE